MINPQAHSTKKKSDSTTSTGGSLSGATSKAAIDERSTSTGVPAAIFNELLSYVNFYRDRSSAEMMKKVIAGFYLPV